MSRWFKNVFQFPEHSDYSLNQQEFKYDPNTGRLSPAGGFKDFNYIAGKFKNPSLRELRDEFESEDFQAAAREVLSSTPLLVEEVVGDVSELHVFPQNRYAVFQAASQFNALEHTSQYGTPEKGITCYSGDHTQGPACATACAPGTIVRNYFAFSPTEGQTKGRQIQNLGDVEEVLDNAKNKYFQVQNGYTMASDASLQKLTAVLRANEKLCDEVRDRLRIGVQEDTEVVCYKFGNVLYDGPKNEQLVTQAYCSACSVSYSRCSSRSWEAFARLVLESLYESTLHIAVQNAVRNRESPGSRKVFLTAVGGGVFGNEMEWVRDAIQRALEKFRDFGLEVYLVSYGAKTREFVQLERHWKEQQAKAA